VDDRSGNVPDATRRVSDRVGGVFEQIARRATDLPRTANRGLRCVADEPGDLASNPVSLRGRGREPRAPPLLSLAHRRQVPLELRETAPGCPLQLLRVLARGGRDIRDALSRCALPASLAHVDPLLAGSVAAAVAGRSPTV
jgi:hypothetical protein